MNQSQKDLSISLAQNDDFLAIAFDEAFSMISENTKISKESLIKQFPENKVLQERVAEMIALAAKVTAETISS